MIPLYMPDAVVGADVDRRRLVLPGSKEWDLPSIRAGLLYAAPFTKSTAPVHSGAGSTGLSTEQVSALGTRARETDDLIVQALLNKARFTKFGMLSELARENLLLQSNAFTTTWVPFNLVTPAQNVTGPDGVANSAWTLTDNGGSAQIYQTIGGGVLTDNLQYTLSVRAKAGTSPDFTLLLRDTVASANRAQIDFQWTAGVLSVKAADVGTVAVRALGGGWYVASATCAASVIVGANAHQVSIYPTDAGGGATGLTSIFYGTQLEVGAAPSTYIPTAASSVVRAADSCGMTASGNIDIRSPHTIMAVFKKNAGSPTNGRIVACNDDNTNLVNLQLNGSVIQLSIFSGGAPQATIGGGTLVDGTIYVATATVAANNAAIYLNGASLATDTSVTMPAANSTNIWLGKDGATAARELNGAIQRLYIWNFAMTAAQVAYTYNRDYRGRWRVV